MADTIFTSFSQFPANDLEFSHMQLSGIDVKRKVRQFATRLAMKKE